MQEGLFFGAWLRKQRRAMDLSRQAFADQVGCAEVTLRRIEAGTLKPSKELASILIEKLGIPEFERSQWVRFARGLAECPNNQVTSSQAREQLTNLPIPLTSFIGREKEQDEIIRLIMQNRLVTIAGAGGIGKTRLALQAGKELLKDYPNGVWVVAFDSLSDPTLVPATVGAVFNIREVSSSQPLLERLTHFLRPKNILLIFDNCEHLLDACAQLIITLFTHCPNLKVLATSREIFNMEGEAIYYAPSLSIPEQDEISIANIRDHESIQLFAERAALVLSSFHLTTDKILITANICRIVDGIPLAIEMAAARVDILQVDEILRQLKDCFNLLVGKSRTALPRHRTMRASVDWSWGLLTESEQVFMRQLSVFAGGWTLEAAQLVCEGDALNLTSALVKKSLIMVIQVSGRKTRYRFHEIIRQYAREKLIEANEEANIRTQHLKYFLILSEQAESELRGPTQVQWLMHLNDERDNLRTALEWAAINDVEAGLYLSGRLQYFWYNFDSLEGTLWLSEFIEKPESNAYPLAKARALCTQGWLLHWNQQLADAHSLAQKCLDLYKDCGDKQGEVEGLLLLASSTNFLGDSRQGGELARQALALAQSLGDTWRQAKAFVTLGWTEGRDLKRRISYWKKAIILFRKVGDLRFLAGKLSAVGYFLALNGDIESAQEYLDESALLVQQFSLKNIASHQVSEGYIQVAMMRGDYEQARRLLQNLEEATKESGDRMSYLHARIRLGQLDLRDGNTTKAHRIFTENVQIFQKDQKKDGVVSTLERMASLYIVIGKPELAAPLIGWADATRKEIGVMRSYVEQVDVDKMIADCLAKIGEIAFSDAYDEGAKMSLDQAVALALKPIEGIN